MATGYLYHELFGWLDPGTRAALFPSDPRRGIQPFQHYDLSDTRRRVHTAEHVARIVAYSDRPGGGDAGDGISPFGCGTYDIAALAAGGGARVGGRGVGQPGAQRLCPDPPRRTPRAGRHRHGVLRVQQHRDRGAARTAHTVAAYLTDIGR
jgi:hypothetical protein